MSFSLVSQSPTSPPTTSPTIDTLALAQDSVAAPSSGGSQSFLATAPGSIFINGANCGAPPLDREAIAEIKEQIEKDACSSLTGAVCRAAVTRLRVTGCGRKLLRPEPSSRDLTSHYGTLEIEFELAIAVYCSSQNCQAAEAQAIANAVYDTSTANLRAAIQNGSFTSVIKLSSVDLNALLSSAAAGTVSFDQLVAPFIAALLDCEFSLIDSLDCLVIKL